MRTVLIGSREFRQNMTKLYKKAQIENLCYIVMHHQKPLMRVVPYAQEHLTMDDLIHEEQGDTRSRHRKKLSADQPTSLHRHHHSFGADNCMCDED